MTTDDLPPLPEPDGVIVTKEPKSFRFDHAWNAKTVEAYARAAIAAQNVRIEELEDELGRAKRKPE